MVVGRDVSKREVGGRFAGDTAAEILKQAQFGRGRECIYLTAGQFSSVDWIDAVLDYTGEAQACIATWTAAAADLDRVEKWIGSTRLLSCEWLVDRSFPNRQPKICDMFRNRFGDDSIRVFATHAKFTLLWNDEGWRVVMLTSANLNKNSRTEFFHCADDPALFDQFWNMKDAVFESQEPGEGFRSDAGKARPFKALKAAGLKDAADRKGVGSAGQIPLF